MLFQNLTEEQIIEKVAKLGSALLKEGSHLFEDYGSIPIIEAVKKQIEKSKHGTDNAAISLIGVVLGANRNWVEVVKPNLDILKRDHPELTIRQLRDKLSEMDWIHFKNFWGHRDEKKYDVLSRLVEQILNYSEKYPTLDDLKLMKQWVREFDLDMLKPDPVRYKSFPGSIPNVGIATFQHLRLTFGVDTVKPDQRVKEVLREEFGLKKVSGLKSIQAVEEIAEITKMRVIMIDKIFVNYGSGYYKNQGHACIL